MTPDQRRVWKRTVLASDALTAAQKVVLMALETYADYRDGTDARPGETNLAEACNLQVRAVRYALERGQQTGLIERTAPANSRAGQAAVYRLVLPITGTVVPVNNPITGMAVPVDNCHDRHGHAPITGMAVPPTYPTPDNWLRNRGTALAACPDCRGTHWLTDEDNNPIGRCQHPRLVTHG